LLIATQFPVFEV